MLSLIWYPERGPGSGAGVIPTTFPQTFHQEF